MEPESLTPPPETNNEKFVSPLHTPEQPGQLHGNTGPERAPAIEQGERKTGAGAGDAGGPTLPPPVPIIVPTQASTDDTATKSAVPAIENNPLTADDVDVIEKEWVVRAKQIIHQTKNDPYQQEHEVSKLQADYLRKRFGVEVKLPQE